jgi:hypothetical protein
MPSRKFHGDERLPVLLSDVMNCADVWVIQRGRRLCFALKAGECLRVAGNFFRKKLEGDEAVEPGILGLVDHTHAPATELFQDAVVRDGLPEK